MNTHHLILGKLKDFLTGDILDDTHDERYRQKLARCLVKKKGYQKEDIQSRQQLTAEAGGKKALVKIDFLIKLDKHIAMIIKYGPGSLVSRRRPALSMSRVISLYQIPVVVVTNGEDAEIIDGATGDVTGSGLESIPYRLDLINQTTGMSLIPISEKQKEMELRIIYAFEVDDSCPCDNDICRIGPQHES